MNIVFCLPGNNFSGRFLDSFVDTIGHCVGKGYQFAVSRRESSNVYHVRSMCLGADVLRGPKQVPFNGGVKYDWIVWIDSDIVWKAEQLTELLNTPGDIVSGLYLMANQQQYTAVKEWDTDYFVKNGTFEFLTPNDLKKETKPFDVSYVGMGFMAVRAGVYETIDYPWFEPQTFDLGNGVTDFCSEDVAFCLKAIKAGYKITINPNIVVGHEKKFII
jgi:hypothetical protein